MEIMRNGEGAWALQSRDFPLHFESNHESRFFGLGIRDKQPFQNRRKSSAQNDSARSGTDRCRELVFLRYG